LTKLPTPIRRFRTCRPPPPRAGTRRGGIAPLDSQEGDEGGVGRTGSVRGPTTIDTIRGIRKTGARWVWRGLGDEWARLARETDVWNGVSPPPIAGARGSCADVAETAPAVHRGPTRSPRGFRVRCCWGREGRGESGVSQLRFTDRCPLCPGWEGLESDARMDLD